MSEQQFFANLSELMAVLSAPLLSVAEVGRLMSLDESAVLAKVERSDIPSLRAGEHIVVPTRELLVASGLPNLYQGVKGLKVS